jgi:predicted DNA-binding transcriptional regulator YafY
MVRKRTKRANDASKAVTSERAARLYHLLQILARSAQPRQVLMRQLNLDVRGFYRDLNFLRAANIGLPLRSGRYHLEEKVESASARLPFPDPHLTLGEAIALAKGRAAVHRKLDRQVQAILKAGSKPAKAKRSRSRTKRR